MTNFRPALKYQVARATSNSLDAIGEWRRIAVAMLLACAFLGCASGSDIVRGNYYWGHEVESFHPCGVERSFWVLGSDSVLQVLREEASRLAKERGKPYQPVYVEALAVQEGKAEDGFAADYDGVYRFTSIQVFSASSPGEGCRTNETTNGAEEINPIP